jgi:molybdopterin molybdotransferase
MISPERAWEILAAALRPLDPVELPPRQGAGLFLATPPVATLPFPPAAVSAMDGYAVRAAEARGQLLPVAFTVQAGDLPAPLPAGTCARIFTGAPLPRGADTVVIQEEVVVTGDRVEFPAQVPAGDNIRAGGEVFAPGAALLPAGTALGPVQHALLAAAGVAKVAVIRPPKVAVVVTGNELTPGRPRGGRIVDSNTPLLVGYVRREPAELLWQRRVGDELAPLQAAMEEAAARADLLLTTGGVSVGDFDLVPRVVAELGGEVLFHKVAMQPGKPVLAARLGKALVLGLPGNSVSVLVGYCLFGRPCLRRLAGDPEAFSLPWQMLPAAAAAHNRGNRVQFRPARGVREAAAPGVEVLPWKGSHDLLTAARATHLARLEPGTVVAPGTPLPTLALS